MGKNNTVGGQIWEPESEQKKKQPVNQVPVSQLNELDDLEEIPDAEP